VIPLTPHRREARSSARVNATTHEAGRLFQRPINMKAKSITTIVAALAAAFIITTAFAASAEAALTGVPKSYALTTCVVSGEKLGEHGKPVKVSSEGTDVWLCCKSCAKKFGKDPAKYVKMVKDAADKK
jgi:YHS domain-containing protein